MAAAKKAAAPKKAATSGARSDSTRSKAEKAGPETRSVTYLAPGQAPDLTPAAPLLDPALEQVREEERKKLDAVTVEPRPEPTIDDELVKARDAQIKRETERAEKSK